MSKIDERAFQAVLLHALNDCPAMLSTEDCRGLIEAYEAAVTPSGVRSAHADDAGQSCPQPPTHQPEIPPKRVVRNAEKQIVGIEPNPESAQQPVECMEAFKKWHAETYGVPFDKYSRQKAARFAGWEAAWIARPPEREPAQPDELREAALHDKAFADGARAGWNAALSTNPRHDDYMRRMDKLSDEARAVLARHTERESVSQNEAIDLLINLRGWIEPDRYKRGSERYKNAMRASEEIREFLENARKS